MSDKKIILAFVLGIFLIGLTSAFTITTFSNGLGNETINPNNIYYYSNLYNDSYNWGRANIWNGTQGIARASPYNLTYDLTQYNRTIGRVSATINGIGIYNYRLAVTFYYLNGTNVTVYGQDYADTIEREETVYNPNYLENVTKIKFSSDGANRDVMYLKNVNIQNYSLTVINIREINILKKSSITEAYINLSGIATTQNISKIEENYDWDRAITWSGKTTIYANAYQAVNNYTIDYYALNRLNATINNITFLARRINPYSAGVNVTFIYQNGSQGSYLISLVSATTTRYNATNPNPNENVTRVLFEAYGGNKDVLFITNVTMYLTQNKSFTGYPRTINVSLNENSFFYYANAFNQLDNKTNNFAGYIQNYLNSCSAVAGYCAVPIKFNYSSDLFIDSSNLYYSNLLVIGNIIDNFSIKYLLNNTENSYSNFTINVTYDNAIHSISAKLIYNNTEYIAEEIAYDNYVSTINTRALAPLVNANNNVSFYFNVRLYNSTYSTYYNSSVYNQTVYNLSFDNCTTYSNRLYNFTIYDETLLTQLNGTSNSTEFNLELYLSPYGSEDKTLFYNKQYLYTNPNLICSNINFTNSSYRVDIIADYVSTGRVKEFYYLDNGTLLNTETKVALYDLKTTESTSFIFNFYNQYGVQIENAIVHVFRKYIGDGLFREVERAKQNNDGQMIVHLLEEDAIYYFMVSQNNNTIYTSDTYTALCQAVPCSITLEQDTGVTEFDNDWDLIDNGGYNLIQNKTSRTVSLSFNLASASTMNLTLYRLENDGSYSPINSSSTTSTSGILTVPIPIAYGNTSFFASVYQDNDFKNSYWVNFNDDASSYFGEEFAVFLAGIIVLALGLIAITEGGIITLIFSFLGLIASSVLGLLDFGRTEINVLIYLILAGGLIIWKVQKRRRGN